MALNRSNNHCANCGYDLEYVNCEGVSGVYFPNGFDIRLCEPCWLEEDAEIDENGNDNPKRLAHYMAMIERLG